MIICAGAIEAAEVQSLRRCHDLPVTISRFELPDVRVDDEVVDVNDGDDEQDTLCGAEAE